jgi:predicted nucleotidyltransferase
MLVACPETVNRKRAAGVLKTDVAGYEGGMPTDEQVFFSDIATSLKRAAGALKRADVPFLLGGSLACWVRGGPETRKDLDLMLKEEDAERALEALVKEGMRPERPPEDWLLKARDGEVMIDLIFRAMGLPISDEVLENGEELDVFSIRMPVMALEDVLATKLLALSDHFLDYESLLQIARSLREQVDWADVHHRTRGSPYARTFFALLDELGIVKSGELAELTGGAARSIKVVPAPGTS